LFDSVPKASETTVAAEKQSKADDLFSGLNPFASVPQKPLSKPDEPASKAAEESKPDANSDNPFEDNSFLGAAQPSSQSEPVVPAKQQQGLTPALKSSLNKGLAALGGAKFDEASFAFKLLCGQVRESAPDKVPTIVNYYIACLAMKSLTGSLSGQALNTLSKEKQDQLAAVGTMLTQLKLHPAHKRAMLAVASVFSDYAYAQFARQNGAAILPSLSINCSHSCFKCHEPCDPTLPRCVSCGEPIVLTADKLDIVTSENISSLKHCTECHCFFSEVNASETHCPVCDGALQ